MRMEEVEEMLGDLTYGGRSRGYFIFTEMLESRYRATVLVRRKTS